MLDKTFQMFIKKDIETEIMPDVELINVTKEYGEKVKVRALNNVSLKVERGDFISVVGPSGSGKTTLLNIMGTLDRPTSGKVLIAGRDVTSMNDDELSEIRNRFIGFVFQSFNLINRLTALENVMLKPQAYRNERRGAAEGCHSQSACGGSCSDSG